MPRIKLHFKHATEIVGSDVDGLIILTDGKEQRQIAIPCDNLMLEEIKLRLQPGRLSRSLEALLTLVRMEDTPLEVVIDSLYAGKYHAILNNIDNLDQVSIDAPDGVLLALASGDTVPLYIDKSLFLRQSSPYNAKANGISLPVNSLSRSMLEQALDKAIKAENYKLASQINDEIKKRNNTDNNKPKE